MSETRGGTIDLAGGSVIVAPVATIEAVQAAPVALGPEEKADAAINMGAESRLMISRMEARLAELEAFVLALRHPMGL